VWKDILKPVKSDSRAAILRPAAAFPLSFPERSDENLILPRLVKRNLVKSKKLEVKSYLIKSKIKNQISKIIQIRIILLRLDIAKGKSLNCSFD
jgi:hypothetical protein